MRRCLAVRLMTLAAVSMMLPGCGSTGGIHIDPQDAAKYVQIGAEKAVDLGLKALSKDAASFANVKKWSGEAKDAIDKAVLPLFTGAGVGDVTLATATQALQILDEKINPVLKGVIQLGVNTALAYIKMPANPTDKLSPDAKAIIVALFNGMSSGAGNFAKWDGPGSRDPSPVPAVGKLGWSYGGKGP